MKLSENFFYTIREDLKDEDSVSSNLLSKAGYIKKSSAGVYIMLPLGFKTITNIENIIRKEMNKINSAEMLMPALIPLDIYKTSNRDEIIGESMYTLKDRYSRDFALAPTHEELFAITAKSAVRSYKHLPFSLYQFQTKYRDEARARYGLIRVREFIMKDAYTFDINDEMCDIAYNKMRQAYNNIFDKLQLDYHVVKADTGIMGGLLSEEYQAVSAIGEDRIVICDNCDYSSNLEVAQANKVSFKNSADVANSKLEKVLTPNVSTIDDVAEYLKTTKDQILKTLIYKYDQGLVAILINGNHNLNESKLEQVLQSEVEVAEPFEVEQLINTKIGFVGPINLNIKIIADLSVENMKNFVVGANETDYHITDVNLNDFTVENYYDLRELDSDDLCPNCQSKLNIYSSIEVGNIFKLGTSYSEAFDLNYLDENNKLNPVVMGSYGIGVGRTLAALVEKFSDEKGINLPMEIAPYKVAILPMNVKNEKQLQYANELYDKLNSLNIDTILDDRNERAGVKFNDIELIGTPIRITVGRKLDENLLELKLRNDEDFQLVSIDEIVERIRELIK